MRLNKYQISGIRYHVMTIRLCYLLLVTCYLLPATCKSQNALGEEIYEQKSNFTPVIKDAAVKQTDQPEIVDTVKKITNVTYSTPSIPYKTNFETSSIEPAKMVNEPLNKLYQSMVKVGFGNYTMPVIVCVAGKRNIKMVLHFY